jgi:hypothetical protein
MIPQILSEVPPIVYAAAAALVVLHIGGGGLGLLSGAAALALPKGERLSRVAGSLFLASMLTMAAIDAGVAALAPKGLDPIMAAFTFADPRAAADRDAGLVPLLAASRPIPNVLKAAATLSLTPVLQR